MEMHKCETKSGKTFFMPIDNDGKVIEPVFLYLKHLAINNSSKNTIRQNCLNLLAFWQYLKDNDFDYIEFVGKKSETCKGAYENLVDYKLHLLYPTLGDNIIPIGGLVPVRKESTVNQMLSSVVSFYRFLSDSDIVGTLPVIQQMNNLQHTHSMLSQMFMKKKKAVKSLLTSKVPEEELRYISEEEFDKCWDACTSRRNRIIIGLMFYGGFRVSEVVGVNLEDLRDIANNVIHITRRDDHDNTDAAVKYDSVGPVVITNRLRDEIVDYLNEDLKDVDTNYLIINFKGENPGSAMKTDTIRKMIKRLGKKVGISDLHPHAFRHGCAMRMLRADIDMMKISNVLRHKNIQTTAETYAKYDLSDKIRVQKELSEKLNEDFAPLDIDFKALAEALREDDDDNE